VLKTGGGTGLKATGCPCFADGITVKNARGAWRKIVESRPLKISRKFRLWDWLTINKIG
jgi:hypothetical protein